MKPLEGTHVLDFTQVLAGPLCTQYLGDLGADIIKVEPVGKGDDTRLWPPFREGFGAVFLNVNRNKRSLALDLKNPESRPIVRSLVEKTDVVIESFAGGVTERLGIDYETLRSINPKIIYCSVSGYGRSGPMKDARGYDLILQARQHQRDAAAQRARAQDGDGAGGDVLWEFERHGDASRFLGGGSSRRF